MKEHRFRVRLRGFDHKTVEQGTQSIVAAVRSLNAVMLGPIPLPTKIERFTVLRSPHVNKKSREQFEMRTHSRLIDILNPNAEIMNALTKIELPSGVDVQVK